MRTVVLALWIGCPQNREMKELSPEATHDPRNHLTTYLLQPNPTLLHKITRELKKVRGLRTPMTTPYTIHANPRG